MHLFPLLFIAFFLFLSGCQTHSHSDRPVLPEYKFEDRENTQADVNNAIARALAADKLLLLVLGAQWCHDSRGLAQQFSTDTMQTLLKSRFETVFVNVGYYKDLRPLTTQFGYPGYFATPSVMVIDPKTKQLLNMPTMAIWNTADSISSNEVFAYFETVGIDRLPPVNKDTEQYTQSQRIQQFADTETERLFSGFELLGPMVQQAVDGQLQDDTQLLALADEIYAFRMALQADIHQLYQQLNSAASDGYKQVIHLPTYGPFSWES
jgi:thioredoxin-related protein